MFGYLFHYKNTLAHIILVSARMSIAFTMICVNKIQVVQDLLANQILTFIVNPINFLTSTTNSYTSYVVRQVDLDIFAQHALTQRRLTRWSGENQAMHTSEISILFQPSPSRRTSHLAPRCCCAIHVVAGTKEKEHRQVVDLDHPKSKWILVAKKSLNGFNSLQV